ncbi:MAG: hypothetical protein U1F61_11830 [Opitutaceae bacterium]
MKTAVLRFLVRWYQASDQPLPPWLDRATRHDSCLSATRAEEELLTSHLRAHPAAPGIEASPFLKSKVLHALARESAGQDRSRSVRWIMPSAAVAGALALGLLLAATWLSRSPNQPSVSTPSALAAVHPTPGTAPAVSAAQPVPEAWSNPLDDEMDKVVADARGAVRFLASAFLPSESLDRLQARKTSG